MTYPLLHARAPVEAVEQRLCAQRGSSLLCAILLISLAIPLCAAQTFDYTKQAEFDDKGNIFVSSDEGKLIRMADTSHCWEAGVAEDLQTVGCMVAGSWETGSFQLEIYLKGGKKKTIEPGAPILDWRFWKGGQEVAVHFGPRAGPGTYALYESTTGRVVEKLQEPADEGSLPQWAKSQAQIQDESVPMSPALAEERTHWIARLLRQIGKIEPGMRRKALLEIFTTEGGISTPQEQTYVSVECPFIKVDVKFKPANDKNDKSDALKEDPDDIIESISKPYLAWSIMD
jgi:hypothetical protein